MMKHLMRFFFTVLFGLSISRICGQSYKETLNVQLPASLNFITIDGKPAAYYELFLTNCSPDTFMLKKVTVINSSDSSICFSMQNQALKNGYSKIGSAVKDTAMQLVPGNTAVVYIQLSLQNKQVKEIVHRIAFEIKGKEGLQEVSMQTSATKCSLHTPLVVGPPLRGNTWAAVYHPSWERGHRRVIYTVNGKARIPGRYAIDFIKIDSGGKYTSGDENSISNWLGYAADVLAVADGVVSSVRDDFSESATLSAHPGYTADKATGNYVSLKIGDNQFAFYEHLKPKSIKVTAGQKVKKGDVIASLGFTGQTTGPHLHFHIADADSPLGAEGTAFVFEQFELSGYYEDFGNFGKTGWIKAKGLMQSNRHKERPRPNAVINFKRR